MDTLTLVNFARIAINIKTESSIRSSLPLAGYLDGQTDHLILAEQ